MQFTFISLTLRSMIIVKTAKFASMKHSIQVDFACPEIKNM